MCGIFGYIGTRNCAPILVEGLMRLEYRGYDSAGLTVSDNGLMTVKMAGRINDLKQRLSTVKLLGTSGIAHTRWSTHGEPNDVNAHPHTDCKGQISIVHNGIIENSAPLKKLLEKEGHVFLSETDSEVLAHLIEKFYDGKLEDAVRQALLMVQGTYGLAVIHKDENKIVVARNGSPLVLGIGKGEMFVASDVAPIIKHTKKVIHLDDKLVAVITRDSFQITDLENVRIDKEAEDISWSLEKIEKAGYEHFMLKEINEQPEAVHNCFRGRLNAEEGRIMLGGLRFSKEFLKNLKKITIVACGTSWHAALIGKYYLEEYCRIPVQVEYASEFRYMNPILSKGDLVIVISQSGETLDTLCALREAKKRGAKTYGVVNVVGSSIARETDCGIYIHAGPEVGVASTKAFTSQVTALYLFTIVLGKIKETLDEKKAIVLGRELDKIPDKIKKILKKSSAIKKLADKYSSKNNFLFLGRGINFPTALEGALKLKEISYIHAEGYPAAEMKHGPIALIDEKMPVVFIANKNGISYDKILSNMQEVKARKGKIIAVASEGDKEIKKLANHVIYVPKTIKPLEPILNVVPLQLLAYYTAILKGHDPDKPRNLAKSVTVE
jgi:glucosamine--fructose-6-phosphate aminotransferase (isomerizing)